MELTPRQESRQARLHEFEQEWDVTISPLPPPLTRPRHVQAAYTDHDVLQAEELLKQQRMEDSQNGHSKSGLSRAFTTKKKAWEHREIYTALVSHVGSRGSPGVAEALISKLNLAGGNLNLAQKSRPSLLTRRKSLDLAERSQVLQRAVENRHGEMVRVLLPFADAQSLDTALPIAFRNRDVEIVESLVKYGASTVQTADGQDAFRQACAAGGLADMVAMVLSSEGKPSPSLLSQCMVEATQVGCLDTVVALSQSTADGNFTNAAALKAAISLGRKDIVLAIALGKKPPGQPGLNEAFEQLMGHQGINPNDKLAITEVLLCAGADGDAVARALMRACAADYFDLVHLLVSYGASVEYEDAIAVRKAVSRGKMDLAKLLLSNKVSLSPLYAAECVELLPKNLRFEDRLSLLSLLLRKGAKGLPLDEALIDVTEVGDEESATLLLTPQFPNGRAVSSTDHKQARKSMAFERHAVASTEHKGALALELAVKKINVSIVKTILANNPPSNPAMAGIFPKLRDLPRAERYQMAEAFLGAGLSGPCVHSALQNAIGETPPRKDDRLIGLLLRSNVDISFNEGAVITTAIGQKDPILLLKLLTSKPTPQVAAKAIPRAMTVDDQEIRLQMVTMLLDAGAADGGSEVSAALRTLLQETAIDMNLLKLLLQKGKADVNYHGGVAIAHAVRQSDPGVLETVLSLGRPTPETVERAVKGLGSAPATPTKAKKLEALLRRTSSKDALSSLLIQEIHNITTAPPEQRSLVVIKTILANGVDINRNNGEALCRAVAAAYAPVVDLLLTVRPNPNALAFAMPHALRIKDSKDRLAFARKVLDGGIPANEVNRALQFAISTYPDDMPLVNVLSSHADITDGLALMQAIKSEKQDLVELVLKQKDFSTNILNTGFAEASRGKDKAQRSLACQSLLKAGASGEVVSDALIAAASDGDLEFGTLLVQNGGSVEHKGGSAVVEACRSGAADVLQMLLSGDTEIAQQTLERGFQAATELSDLKKRAAIFELLLGRGVGGEVVDAQLVSAERYGDDGTELVKLLLIHGASPDYDGGQAVEMAAQSAFLGNLEMLLGIVEVGGKQKKPSSATLVRALGACWKLSRETRFTIMEWIFKAGEPVPDGVHAALARAVAEEDPEDRLIQLLVANGASPTANGCQTLIEATRTLSIENFEKLLESQISAEEASFAFEKAFAPEHVELWLTERGLEVANRLLGKKASGKGIESAFVAVLGVYSQTPGEVADKFVDLMLEYGADINYNHGEALQNAAAQGNIALMRRLLKNKPSSESLTLAFPRIFDTSDEEDDVHEIISLFAEYANGQHQMDVMFVQPGTEPATIRALTQFPRSTKIMQALLDVGYYHDQMTTYRVVVPEHEEDEQVTLLTWALLQPQKKISSGVLNLLIERGGTSVVAHPVARISSC
jgi:ankyrin repeat protein